MAPAVLGLAILAAFLSELSFGGGRGEAIFNFPFSSEKRSTKRVIADMTLGSLFFSLIIRSGFGGGLAAATRSTGLATFAGVHVATPRSTVPSAKTSKQSQTGNAIVDCVI